MLITRQLPQTGCPPILPPKVEELWTRRDAIYCGLEGAKIWMRLFNEDVLQMRINIDPQAKAYAAWGEPFFERIIGYDIPRLTLDMRGVEETMVAVMEGKM